MTRTIFVDLDGTLVNFIGPLCKLLNQDDVHKARWPGPFRVPEQFQSYPLEDTLSRHELKLVESWMQDNTLAEARVWYQGARAFLTHLQRQRPTVILTAGGPGGWNKQTAEFVARAGKAHKLQFAPPEAKPSFDGLTLIEDRPDTATRWSEKNKAFSILMDRPWNRSVEVGPRVLRARDYHHARSLLQGLLR